MMESLKRVQIGGRWFGGREDDGTVWLLGDVESWEDISFRGDIVNRPWNDGGWHSRTWVAPAHFAINLFVECPDPDQVEKRIAEVRQVLPIRVESPVTVDTAFSVTQVNARVEDTFLVKRLGDRAAQMSIQMVAPDPRRFISNAGGDLLWKEAETGLPHTEGGLTFPLVFPFVFGGTETSGYLDIHIGGTSKAKGIIALTGPAYRPVVSFQNGASMRFDLNLSAGETLEIDLDRRTVMLGGTASRRGAMSGSFPVLSPGAHRVSWVASGYDPAALMRLRWVESW